MNDSDAALPPPETPEPVPIENITKENSKSFFAIPGWMKWIGGHVHTHNPFYLISTGFVLFGLQTSFAGNHELANGWLLMELLCGYTVLLATVGCFIVRLGNVWEDARMILLVILLLFVALSNSFDRFVLDEYITGGQMLAVGFLFVVILTESLFYFLPMRLAWRYRIPMYLQLGLLFAYPVWLAYLSINDYQPEMAWYVFLFPVFCAAALLALFPAAHLAGKGEPPSGTPWRWPWYPWPVFVFLGIGLMLRSYSLSVSFEIAGGFSSAFHFYYLLPPLLVGVLLIVEACVVTGKRETANSLLLVPMCMLPLALPGTVHNSAQMFMSELLYNSIGEPGRLYVAALVLFYAYTWFRRLPSGEFMMILSLALLSVMGPGTRNIGSMQYPIWQPLAAAILLELGLGLRYRSSLRILGCTLAALWGVHYFGQEVLPNHHFSVYLTFVGLSMVLLTGMLCRDWLAKWIRKQTPIILMGGSLLTAALVIWQVPLLGRLIMLTILIVIAFVTWRRERDVLHLLSLMVSAASISLLLIDPVHQLAKDSILEKGLYWLLAGLLMLAAGVLISLQKGGMLGRVQQWLKELNHAWTSP